MTDRENTAFHESGHVVMCHLLGAKVTRAAIEIGNGNWKGSTSHFQAGSIKQDVMVSLAGQVAQQRYHQDPTSLGSWSDFYNSYQLLDGDLDLLNLYKNEAQVLIDEHWSEVEIVASALLTAGTLSGDQITNVLKQEVFP